MDGNKLTLDVPFVKDIRHTIRKEVETYFADLHMMPPVSYATLVEISSMLLEKHGWNPDYKAFVMVCCGNAIWRQVVSAVPYNRRILLLPQCLKNSKLCKGEQDELGLLCSECGNCSISGLLREAENLGYVAIVTEGATITARLIESGKVDAVIGVGCMEVLQKMFVSVSKFSIPSIGIPLLTCGCTDTLADSEWIKEEIYAFDQNSTFRLLNLNYLRNRTASIFGEEQLNRILETSQDPTEQMVKESLLAGGKRLRPLLTVLAYEAFSKQINPGDVNRLALSVECFHKASLIHDDIEDDDDERYGRETLHARYGVPIAINIGDLLIGEGYRLLAETSFSPEIIRECIRVVSKGHRTLSIGQGSELISLREHKILSLKETLEVFQNKTAAAFKVSLLLGATAAGADQTEIEMLGNFSNLIGIAYQIKDDMEDFQNPEDEFEIERPSVLMSLLYEKALSNGYDSFQQAFSANNIPAIKHLVEKYRIREDAERLLKDYIAQTSTCLNSFQNMGLKLALHEILGKTFKDYI